ncbi:tetratricopeptide repeat protein [Roseobacter sp. HKCCA0434]|uniref:tetratricopeptide repeat protein n=1 Tax=Roseobacter sp. HKCCA0434 TaxID=3079297 RepID=UPI002905DF17|nr:tetratricopeptide repeat protein [Roseobacter sp. HKCCA0434]
MSETDSFIDEVSEEVRRDRLYTYARRYGWIAVLAVLLIVGGAAWNEWREARDTTAARERGAALDTALAEEDPAARAETLAGIEESTAIVTLAEATALSEAGEAAEAASLLDAMIEDPDTPATYVALATLRRVALPGAVPPPEDAIALLDPVIAEDGPMVPLALEQRGLAHLAAGDVDAAHEDFRFALEDPLTTAALRDRVGQMILATGGTPGAGALVTPNSEN